MNLLRARRHKGLMPYAPMGALIAGEIVNVIVQGTPKMACTQEPQRPRIAGRPVIENVKFSPVAEIESMISTPTSKLVACSTAPEHVPVVAHGGAGYAMVKSNGPDTVQRKCRAFTTPMIEETPSIVIG